MKAIVIMELVEPTRLGRQIISEKIIGTRNNIAGKVNEFIYARLHNDFSIPVKTFKVKMYSQNGNLVKSTKYSPTYRTNE